MITQRTKCFGLSAVAGALAMTAGATQPVITNLVRTTVQVPVDVVLLDMDSTIYRGLPVVNPDQNGNYWNINLVGVFATNLVNCANVPTTIDFGFSTPVAFDSYNGPAGPTSASTLTTDVLNTDIDVAALGKLGVTNAAFDYITNPVTYPVTENVRFTIQGLDPNLLYDLTFFSSHKYNDFPTNNDDTTVFTVYSDNTYTTVVDSVEVTHGIGPLHNRDTLATITGLSPQTTNYFLYVDVRGGLGGKGYLNAMMIVSTAPAEAAEISWNGTTGVFYSVEEATDLVASNWTPVVSGLPGAATSMTAAVLLDYPSAAFRIDQQTPVTLFSDTFESGTNGWTFGDDNGVATDWQLGPPTSVGPAGAKSPSNCWGTNIGAYYGDGAECWLRSPAIDLTSVSNAVLRWQQAVDIEDGGVPFDWGEVNILDAGNTPILSVLGGKISGEDPAPAWTEATLSLAAAAGNVIKIEFRFKSDGFNIANYAGWYIDDVVVSDQ